MSLPLPLLYYDYLFLLAEAGLSPLPENSAPTHLPEEVSPQGPHSPSSSSRVCPASTDTCLLRLVKYYVVIFLWVCLFSSCPVSGFPAWHVGVRTGEGGRQDEQPYSQPGEGPSSRVPAFLPVSLFCRRWLDIHKANALSRGGSLGCSSVREW